MHDLTIKERFVLRTTSGSVLDVSAFLTGKLEAKMPSCPHFCSNLFIMNCLLMVVASILVRALPSLALTNIDTYSCIMRLFSVIYASFYRLFRFDVKQSVFRLFPCKMCALKGLYLHGI
ncbi:hypothetical protein E5339_09565 [Phocaeicola sartorii]|uniref:Uncharacterized protein n=1 Tax=Phocaeicola sartorii TaxID=671267 RepID=A0A4S2FN83_9BACT|nr:hypothetical protein E5339_09565 [Phocaeicola sartorii]